MERWFEYSGEQKAGENKGYFCKWAEDRKPAMLYDFFLNEHVDFNFYLPPFEAGCWLTAICVASCETRSGLATRPSPLGPGLHWAGRARQALSWLRLDCLEERVHIIPLTQVQKSRKPKRGAFAFM